MDIVLMHKAKDSRYINTGSNTPDAQKKRYSGVTLKGNVNLVSPTIELLGVDIEEIATYNYMYIPKFGRYYYVTAEVDAGKIVRLQGNIDAGYTFRADINASNNVVARQEKTFNKYLQDKLLPLSSQQAIFTKNIGTVTEDSNIMILAISEGKKVNIQ